MARKTQDTSVRLVRPKRRPRVPQTGAMTATTICRWLLPAPAAFAVGAAVALLGTSELRVGAVALPLLLGVAVAEIVLVRRQGLRMVWAALGPADRALAQFAAGVTAGALLA